MKFILCLSTCLLILGCGSDRFAFQDYQLNNSSSSTVGSTLMSWGYGHKGGFLSKGVVDGMRMELNYGGRDHNVIRVNYREYGVGEQGEFTRSSYCQEFKYDLSQSTTITFRDIRIAIDSADQQKLVYRILQGPQGMTGTILPTSSGIVGMNLDNSRYVSAVASASKADLAGINVGDKLVKVNDKPLDNRSLSEIASMFKGNPESYVEIMIDRNGTQMNFMIQRSR